MQDSVFMNNCRRVIKSQSAEITVCKFYFIFVFGFLIQADAKIGSLEMQLKVKQMQDVLLMLSLIAFLWQAMNRFIW